MIRVAMLSLKDYAGSGKLMCDAMKLQGIDARLCTAMDNRYGYCSDFQIGKSPRNAIIDWIRSADIIHFKGDELPISNWHGLTIPRSRPWVVTVGGSGFRRLPYKSPVSWPFAPIKKYIEATAFRSCLTPDLNYPEFEGHYIQHAADTRRTAKTWEMPAVPIIAHSPSNRIKKGTAIIYEAMRFLEGRNIPFKKELIENVTNAECIARKSLSTIFIDQVADTGFYGMAAVEAMQFGIPTIARISQMARMQSQGKVGKSFPVLSVSRDPEDLFELLYFLLTNPEQLQKISRDTKRFADSFHSLQTVGKIWADVYKQILN